MLNLSAINFKKIEDIPRELGYCIKKLKETEHGIQVEFYNKMRAFELIGKMKNFYGETIQLPEGGITVNFTKRE